MSDDAGSVVSAMIAAVEARDIETVLGHLADDVVYDNVPMAAVRGHAGARSILGPLLQNASAVEWTVHRQAVNGDTVLNERTDRFQLNGAWVEVGVAGVFVVTDGRITLWRDYFDLGQMQQQLTAAANAR